MKTDVGYLFIFLAALLWALIGVFTRGLIDVGLGAMEIAFWRALFGGGLFLVHALVARQMWLRSRRDAGTFLAFGLIGVTLFFGAYSQAIDTGGISLAVVLLYTAPVFVVILARLVLKEPLSAAKIAAVTMVVVGVSLVAFGNPSEGVHVTTASVLWGLAAGLGYASFYILGKQILENYAPVTAYAYILPVGAVGLYFFVDFAPKSTTAWLLIALLSIFSTYLAYLLYFIGLKRLEASRAVLVASLEPVIAASLAALIFGERLGWLGLLGATLVVSASLVAVLRR